jgi:methanethiol S-methyltransferase
MRRIGAPGTARTPQEPTWQRAVNRLQVVTGAVRCVAYALASRALFLVTFLCAIGFVGNPFVPKTVDVGGSAPLPEALAVNVVLLGLFAVQHSVMARQGFRRWWTRFVAPSIARRTFVRAASLALLLLFWQWRPITGVGSLAGRRTCAQRGAARGVMARLGAAAGAHVPHQPLRAVWPEPRLCAAARSSAADAGVQDAVVLSRRAPPNLARVSARVLGRAPTMTVGHLLFSVATTGYILIGIDFEERDLITQFGDRYRFYRELVGMLLPRTGKARGRP